MSTEHVVRSLSGRLSLRAPQRESLERLNRSLELAPDALKLGERDLPAILAQLQAVFPTLTDFERDFPSLCFALATGVGKTRLMGAFVSYLYLAHGIQNFFVLAPNLTIYDKLIADFTPNTPKYVFKGIAEFAAAPPEIITGDNYEQRAAQVQGGLLSPVTINIFNISKINSEVRGGKSPRIKRLSEYIGQSYFDYLAALPDLVLLMDESHRYRASAGVRAINELKPLLGLEVTATPFVESAKAPIPFRNVVMDYPLARAMDDGFVKTPAVVTQRNFNAGQYPADVLEGIKLKDGVRLHEATKVELTTYAHQNGVAAVKPFMLVIARDTTHAAALLGLIQSDGFFEGRYRDKAIQVDSSKSGADEEEMIRRLLAVESVDEPTEIVIHVNMLKEGWDVTNLYTIVPLRAANVRTLIEQSIGRGLRLGIVERRPEDYIVHALIDFDDIDYDSHAVLLYDLAGQAVASLRERLSSEDELRNVLDGYRRLIAENIHAQMVARYDEGAAEYVAEVKRGFTALKQCSYSVAAGEAPRHFRETVTDVGRIKQMLFGGFANCLYPLQRFDSDTERRFAIILENDAKKWFKPAKGQFQIFYRRGSEQPEYVPDFVVETADRVLMCETKARVDMTDDEVEAKATAARKWCTYASEYGRSVGGKPWEYLLIPHDEVQENRTLDYLRAVTGQK